jgi:O-antigen ligase
VAFAYNEARARNVGQQPGVDNAYLTVGIKSGVVGMTLFGALLLVPLWASMRPALRRLRPWYLPTWLGIGVLTMTQGFAVSSYGPLALALLAAVPFLGYTRSTRSAATDQR